MIFRSCLPPEALEVVRKFTEKAQEHNQKFGWSLHKWGQTYSHRRFCTYGRKRSPTWHN